MSIMSSKKTIIITGASGYIGSTIAIRAIEAGFCVIAATSSPDSLKEKLGERDNLKIIDNSCILQEKLPKADVMIHCAFSRRYNSNADVASSLDFAKNAFSAAVKSKAALIINISSQGVYGDMQGCRDEKTSPSPTMPYTMAKYASEVILRTVCENTKTHFTNLRMDSIAGNQKITHSFIEQAMEKGVINIVGGEQRFSFLDVEDAVSAIITAAGMPPAAVKPIYNIGWNEKRYKIGELADIAADVVGGAEAKKG